MSCINWEKKKKKERKSKYKIVCYSDTFTNVILDNWNRRMRKWQKWMPHQSTTTGWENDRSECRTATGWENDRSECRTTTGWENDRSECRTVTGWENDVLARNAASGQYLHRLHWLRNDIIRRCICVMPKVWVRMHSVLLIIMTAARESYFLFPYHVLWSLNFLSWVWQPPRMQPISLQ